MRTLWTMNHECQGKTRWVSVLSYMYNLWRQRHIRGWGWDKIIRSGTRTEICYKNIQNFRYWIVVLRKNIDKKNSCLLRIFDGYMVDINEEEPSIALWERRRSYQSKYQFSIKMFGHSSFCRENSTDDWTRNQSISGEILTHLKKKYIFLTQKLTKLEHLS